MELRRSRGGDDGVNWIEMSMNWGIERGVVLYGGNEYKCELSELDSVS